MTLQQLKYILTIAETGSMNKASEQLYVSQPNLTSAVKELENELGFSVFHRSGRGVTLTADGVEFAAYARQVLMQMEALNDRFLSGTSRRKHFAVSTQHYSFAVQAFARTVQEYDPANYDFAIRETKTQTVIDDVALLRSEIGILYLSDFNRSIMTKMFKAKGVEFHPLAHCRAYVYLSTAHPLAKEKGITLAQLQDYPCLSFEQGEHDSFYFAEEILTTREYPRTIHTTDRATNLNLLVALNAYTLCSGVICEELNGPDFVAVPYLDDSENPNSVMEIGYLTKKGMKVSGMGQRYIEEITRYLNEYTRRLE
ncbi:MAG: LysR family transcriptional regulator [Clostridia bacterium]|nr:LysR family transcriptional regulator [Clostridia bacterium]